MDKQNLLTIGNLSKQTGVHVKSLRYYEQLGILLPAYTDPDTGYRYYTLSQIPVVDAIREYDPELAQKILDEMFVFENLMDIDDRSIQMILREVQSDSLILALKGASPELREKIFKNMSQRAAEMLREDLESKGPVRLSEVEAEQKEILKVVRRLADEGQIVLGGAGGEQMI